MKKHFDLQASVDCASCSTCYKCVKSCPVNAIKIENEDVFESKTLCIDCGNCYKVCHKGVHLSSYNPIELEDYLKHNKVIALLDTMFFMNLEDYRINQIEEALLKAGFAAVETAFDGLSVHDYIVNTVHKSTGEFYFNSNCVPFINYLKKFNPELTDKLLPYRTATEISAILKKEQYGDDYKILLVTNCFGDFNFVDTNCSIDTALLTSELEDYLKSKNINISDIPPTMEKREVFEIEHFSSIAQNVIYGMQSCSNVMDYASKTDLKMDSPLRFFLCTGGCFNSKLFSDNKKPFEREQRYSKFINENFDFKKVNKDSIDSFGDLNRFKVTHKKEGVKATQFTNHAIDTILEGLGLYKELPEYDCNSCGYGSCRDFAIAVLNDRANYRQCVPYINRINVRQSKEMAKMISELNEAFSLTIPDNRLEKKLKTTPAYVGLYDNSTDYIEITKVIDEGLYTHIINCLKLAADLKDYNVFDLIGIDKNILVQTILYHCNAKTQPLLCKGDVVKYSDFFEDKKEEAARSAIFAKKYYNVADSVFSIIKYHKHDENEIPEEFPKHLLYVFRLFKIIDSTSSVITKSEIPIEINFEFVDFILYIHKTKNGIKTEYTVDLYRQQDFKAFEKFLKE